MTKKEFLSQKVDDLRASLLEMFEDPAGELASMTKQPLIAFAKENWDHIEATMAAEEPEEEVEEEVEVPLDPEPEPVAVESPATAVMSLSDEEWQGDPRTNLAVGAHGNPQQRVGTRNLA